MNAVSATGRWALPPDLALEWRSWGEAHFCFDDRSGQTHFFNGTAVEILRLLEAGARSADDLVGELRATAGDEGPPEALAEAVTSVLVVLDRLGIIEPQP